MSAKDPKEAMGRDAEEAIARSPEPPRVDVKSEVARALIAAMEKGETPWQRPWNAASMMPMNPTSGGRQYRGINRVLLALQGREDGRWVTYRQAQEQGWQVRKGERGTMIVKVVELETGRDDDYAKRLGSPSSVDPAKEEGAPKRYALRRYFVFNAEQIDGMPAMEAAGDLAFDPVKRAESAIDAMKEMTGLLVVHGGTKAFYDPARDEVRLPPQKKFHSVYDYYATALHECGHATLHEKRMNRRNALGLSFGDEAYAMEELRAEIASAILAAETGVQPTDAAREKHIRNHAAYLQSWLKVLRRDPLAVMSAARDADRMAEYIMGLERQWAAREEHKEWLAEYEAAPSR